MGTNISAQSNTAITDIVNDSISKISNEVKNNVLSITKSTNNIVIDISGVTATGNFSISQINDVATKALLTSDTQVLNKLAAEISNSVKDQLLATLAQTNEDLNIGQTNVAVQNQTAIKKVASNVLQDIKTGIENTVRVETDASQTIHITIKDSRFKNVSVSQESLVRNVSENIAKSIADSSATAMLSTEATTEMKSAVAQTNKGLDIMAFFTTAAIALVLVGGLIIFIKSGQGSNKVPPMAIPVAMPVASPMATLGGASKRTKVSLGVIVILILLLGIQYYIHYQYTILKTSPITGKMVKDPPFTLFSLF
jgi:hypothetical protein